MPIYEYECTDCGHTMEVWQKFSDEPLSECDHCHGHMKKLISQSTFHLKGSGWYVTDYANKRTSGGAASDKPKSENTVTDSSTKGADTASKKTESSSGSTSE